MRLNKCPKCNDMTYARKCPNCGIEVKDSL